MINAHTRRTNHGGISVSMDGGITLTKKRFSSEFISQTALPDGMSKS